MRAIWILLTIVLFVGVGVAISRCSNDEESQAVNISRNVANTDTITSEDKDNTPVSQAESSQISTGNNESTPIESPISIDSKDTTESSKTTMNPTTSTVRDTNSTATKPSTHNTPNIYMHAESINKNSKGSNDSTKPANKALTTKDNSSNAHKNSHTKNDSTNKTSNKHIATKYSDKHSTNDKNTTNKEKTDNIKDSNESIKQEQSRDIKESNAQSKQEGESQNTTEQKQDNQEEILTKDDSKEEQSNKEDSNNNDENDKEAQDTVAIDNNQENRQEVLDSNDSDNRHDDTQQEDKENANDYKAQDNNADSKEYEKDDVTKDPAENKKRQAYCVIAPLCDDRVISEELAEISLEAHARIRAKEQRERKGEKAESDFISLWRHTKHAILPKVTSHVVDIREIWLDSDEKNRQCEARYYTEVLEDFGNGWLDKKGDKSPIYSAKYNVSCVDNNQEISIADNEDDIKKIFSNNLLYKDPSYTLPPPLCEDAKAIELITHSAFNYHAETRVYQLRRQKGATAQDKFLSLWEKTQEILYPKLRAHIENIRSQGINTSGNIRRCEATYHTEVIEDFGNGWSDKKGEKSPEYIIYYTIKHGKEEDIVVKIEAQNRTK